MSTLKVDTILKRTGTGTITVGQSGDTISIPSGATLSVAGSSVTAVDNTPSFFAFLSSGQTISDNTITKVQFNSELFDTDSAYDSSSNYRFTVPSGEAGKYYFFYSISCHSLAASNLETTDGFFYKNGTAVNEQSADFRDNPGRRFALTNSIVLDLSASDYIEVFGRIDDNSGSPRFDGAATYNSYFTGYKLIG